MLKKRYTQSMSSGYGKWQHWLLLTVLFLVHTSGYAETGTDSSNSSPSDWAIFFGRFHPLIVHLPIGFLLIAFLLESASRIKAYRELAYATPFVLFLGIISAIVSALAGYLLSLGGGYDEDALFWHQWLGIGVVIISALAYILKLYSRRNISAVAQKAYLPAFTVAIIMLMLAGHYGGSLTHGSDYLTAYMPPPLRKLAGLPPRTTIEAQPITNIQEAVVFRDIIHPILDAQCISCHNPSKKKGDLLLHTPEAILAGGESGPSLVAGDAEKSELIKRLLLPPSHDDHMPPKGKKQPTAAQIEIIRWWIDQGASFDKTVAELSVSDEAKVALTSLGAGEVIDAGIFAMPVPPANPADIAQVSKHGFQIMTIAQDVNFLQVKLLSKHDSIQRKPLIALNPLAEQITWLDISHAPVSDTTLAGLKTLKHISRLHLEQSTITDKGLIHLQELPHLEYLNLYGTAITDKGLELLVPLKKLKTLYLWQTKVTPEGVKRLQVQSPDLTINVGWNSDDAKTEDPMPSSAVIHTANAK